MEKRRLRGDLVALHNSFAEGDSKIWVEFCSKGTELLGVPAAPAAFPLLWVIPQGPEVTPTQLSKSSSCPGSWQMFLHLQECFLSSFSR